MKTIKQRAEARAQELGVTFEESGARYFELLVQAPSGKVFAGSGLHEAVFEQDDFTKRGQLWKEALVEMELGLEDCSEADCDWCAEMERHKNNGGH